MLRGDGEGFSEEQLQMYKDCFKLMDINKVFENLDDSIAFNEDMLLAYLIFVIFFTLAKFLEDKIYTEKRQLFALNL